MGKTGIDSSAFSEIVQLFFEPREVVAPWGRADWALCFRSTEFPKMLQNGEK
jgi:hypothetical protein